MGALVRLYDIRKFREGVIDTLNRRISEIIDNYPVEIGMTQAEEIVAHATDKIVAIYPHMKSNRAFVAQQVASMVMSRYIVEPKERRHGKREEES